MSLCWQGGPVHWVVQQCTDGRDVQDAWAAGAEAVPEAV